MQCNYLDDDQSTWLIRGFKDVSLDVEFKFYHINCNNVVMTNDFLGLIRDKQLGDPTLICTRELLGTNQVKDFSVDPDGMQRLREKLFSFAQD